MITESLNGSDAMRVLAERTYSVELLIHVAGNMLHDAVLQHGDMEVTCSSVGELTVKRNGVPVAGYWTIRSEGNDSFFDAGHTCDGCEPPLQTGEYRLLIEG